MSQHPVRSAVPAQERVKKSELQASGRLRSVIPAKAGIHFRRWNKALDGSPPPRGRRCGPDFKRFGDFFTRSFAGMRPRIARPVFALTLLALVQGAAPAGAADNRYPDWPCHQVKVPELSVAAIWPDPLPENSANAASEAPGLNDIVARLSARKTPIEEAEKDIAAFVTGPAEERKKKAGLLFMGLFDALNAQRFQVMNGIERAYRKQKDFAEKIRSDTEKLRELQDANADSARSKSRPRRSNGKPAFSTTAAKR